MANEADQELFRAVEQWLDNNPGKNIADWKKETGYKGPLLKKRNRAGEPIRVSYKGRSTSAQQLRASREKPKTEGEARYVTELKKQIKRVNESTEAQFVSSGKAAIAEHDVRLASGGSNEYMSISDPEFKVWKDTIEAKAASKFGDKVVVDIDDVSGDVRVIPASIHNKFQPTSVQPGIDIPVGSSIDDSFKQVNNLLEQPLSKLVKPLQEFDFSGGKARFKGAGSVLPLVGVAAGVLGAGEAFAAGDPREGVARLLEAGAGEIPIAGDVVQPEGVAGGTFEDVERRTAEGLRARELQQRATEARQRGGKLSFGVGGVRFKLPEFGLSELMGIN
jgi:hypothetical protein